MDRYNRVVAICFKKRRDVNSWLVRNGLAVDYTKYSKKYIINENYEKKRKMNELKEIYLQYFILYCGKIKIENIKIIPKYIASE